MMSPPPGPGVSDIQIESIEISDSIELIHPIYFYLIMWILSFRRLLSDHPTLSERELCFPKIKEMVQIRITQLYKQHGGQGLETVGLWSGRWPAPCGDVNGTVRKKSDHLSISVVWKESFVLLGIGLSGQIKIKA